MARQSLIRFQRVGQIALGHLHVADLVVRYRQVALPSGVAGVGLRQALPDGETRLIGGQRGGQSALRHLHVADLVV